MNTAATYQIAMSAARMKAIGRMFFIDAPARARARATGPPAQSS
jgi:hypothetical protein